jgi:hypothetical protein
MLHTRRNLQFASLISLCLAASVSYAQTTPANAFLSIYGCEFSAEPQGQCATSSNFTTVSQSGEYEGTPPGGTGSATASGSFLKPTFTASASGVGGSGTTSDVYFEITGGTGSVQALYSATASTSATGPTDANKDAPHASVTYNINGPAGTAPLVQLLAQTGYGSTAGPSSFSAQNLSVTLQAGTVYNEEMATGVAGYAAGDSGNASLDPSVSLTSAEITQGYSIIYGSNVSTVPLPATACLLLSGLAGLGLLGRRRQLQLPV